MDPSEHADVAPEDANVTPTEMKQAASWRAVGLLCFWLALTGSDLAALPAGAIAAVAATWASMRLLPPSTEHARLAKLAPFAFRFLYQAIKAGVQVAWLALDPRLPLRPGFVIYYPLLPPGARRNAFCAVTSLLPGTLPSGSIGDDELVIHCLDLDQPATQQLAAEERSFLQIFGGSRSDG